MSRILTTRRNFVIWLLCFSLVSSSLSSVPPVAAAPEQSDPSTRAHVGLPIETTAGVEALPSSVGTEVVTQTTPTANLMVTSFEPVPWQQGSRSLRAAMAATAIRITESGLEPSRVALFGPSDVTWINNTTITQTLKSGAAPPQPDNRIYLPVVMAQATAARVAPASQSNAEIHSALQRALSIMQQTATDDFTIILGPGQSHTRRFSAPGAYIFHLVGTVYEGQLGLSGTTLVSTSPVDGDGAVAATRETILTFSGPLDPSSVSADVFNAHFGSRALAFRHVLSADRKRVTLFYESPLPGNARVQITIDGNKLKDAEGLAVDVDINGVAGGVRTLSFDTLSLTVIPGTSACGRVFASELSTTVSGASVNTPLQGATITVDGMESVLRTTTDANGNFCLDPSPAGLFFVHVDGRTATNGVPTGAYYPYVGKPWQTVVGQRNEVGDVFLPLVPPGTLQAVSGTEDTQITFIPDILEQHPNFAGVSVLVPADSLYADDGTRGGRVGIAPVPPDRLPGNLPDGLEFPVVITVQTDGATNFDVPVPVCFPNLPDPVGGGTLPPGAKDYLFSFNHDTGAWEAIGSMTVTADGTLVCSDPGVGIEAPGWHGAGPPPAGPPPPPDGGCGEGLSRQGCEPEPCDPTRFYLCVALTTILAAACYVGCVATALGAGIACTGASAGLATALCFAAALVFAAACETVCVAGGGLGLLGCESTYGCAGASMARRSLDVNALIVDDPIVQQIVDLTQEMLALVSPYAMAGTEIPPDVVDQVEALLAQAHAAAGGDAQAYLHSYLLALETEAALNTAELGERPGNAPSYGVRYFAEIMRPNGPLRLRGVTEAHGQYTLFLPRDGQLLVVAFYDPQTHSYGFVHPNRRPNAPYRLPHFYLSPVDSTFSDFDGDGLADVVEVIYGTETGKPDSDGDGVSDGVEVQQGTNPLDGMAMTNGVIASVDTPGTAVDVCAEGDLAVMADSGAGVSILNVFSGVNPIIIAQVDTPGNAQAVACAVDRIAVADGSNGLAIINTSTPSNARIERQIPLNGSAQAVAAAGPFAFVGTSLGQLAVVELASGDVPTQQDLGEAIHDLAVEGERLYVLTQSALIVYDQSAGQLSQLARVNISGSPAPLETGRKLFVGGSLAYVGYFTGYSIFDVSGITPNLIGAPPATQLAIHDLKTNGSGLLLGVTSFLGEETLALSLYDVSNPADVSLFVTSFDTPGDARALFIHNGLAYVADSAAGLQVINYLSADRGGNAPSIRLESNFAAAVAEASVPMRLTAVVTDDVQVRNVTFYLNGEVVAVDGSYPFEYRFTTPPLAQGSFRLRARASDTGGNESWTNELTIPLVDDATPPRLLATTPQSNSFAPADTVQTLLASFSEALNATTVNSTTFRLFSAGADWLLGTEDDQPIAGAVAYDAASHTATFSLPATLSAGRYRVALASTLTDLAGNPRAGGEYAWSFSVGVAVWDGGGDGIAWHDPRNWTQDQVPPQDALVVIEDSRRDPVVYSQGTTSLSTLHSNRPLQISGTGTLGIQGAGTLAHLSISSNLATLDIQGKALLGDLDLGSGILTGSGVVTVTGVLTWTSGRMTGPGKTVSLGGLVLNGQDMYLDGRTFANEGTAVWTTSNNASTLYLANGAVFNNLPGASFQLSADVLAARIFGADGSAYSFNNSGSFVKSNTNDLAIFVPFSNAGSVDVQAGRLDLGGGISTGNFDVATGSILRVGRTASHTFSSDASFSGDGTLEISAGSISFTDNHTVARLHMSGGTLTGGGVVTVTGVLTWTSGRMTGPGKTVSLGSLVLNGDQVALDGRTFDNGGTAVWTRSNNGSYFYLANGAVFNNLPGASFQLSADVIYAQIYGDGSAYSFNNNGSFVKSNTSDLSISVPFRNSGSVNVASGLLQIYNGDNTGTMTIGAGTTLVIDGVFINQASGVINGSGTLDLRTATFTNSGTIAPTVIVIN